MVFSAEPNTKALGSLLSSKSGLILTPTFTASSSSRVHVVVEDEDESEDAIDFLLDEAICASTAAEEHEGRESFLDLFLAGDFCSYLVS
mmetsp:Transcript_30327/g.65481  ORF Transcript_30327/g.65481 Transcript_30327/m.65481 type:complete len:89 (+) Transcript_30327:1374-1640(+)